MRCVRIRAGRRTGIAGDPVTHRPPRHDKRPEEPIGDIYANAGSAVRPRGGTAPFSGGDSDPTAAAHFFSTQTAPARLVPGDGGQRPAAPGVERGMNRL